MNRMRRSGDFAAVVGDGRRVRFGTLVVHQLTCPAVRAPAVGLVVARTVGNSVVRHRVARRLRAQLAARLGQLPVGSGTVVRALPTAAAASSAELRADLDGALTRLGQSAVAR